MNTVVGKNAAAAAVVLSLLASAALAGVERIEITDRQHVAGGRAFGLAGPYERLLGTVHFTLDPDHPANARVVDLDKAPRDAAGKVRYSADLYVIRPVDPARGNGTLLVEIPNRGGKAMVRYFNRGRRVLDPIRARALGDGFLMRQGFTLVWIGWQFDVPERNKRLRLYPAYATAVETPLRGLVRADHVFALDAKTLPLGNREHVAYPVADPQDSRNRLTVRDQPLGPRRLIPRERWRLGRFDTINVVPDSRFIHYEDGFEKGKIYEAVYVAREPAIVGLGLTAIRDLVSHLKHDESSPVPGKRAIAFGVSQTGRFLRHFLYQGFNADAEGRAVFDGVFAHTAGAGRGSFNHRFGQPSRDAHPFSAFFYPTDIFPFSGAVQRDPETGLEHGLFKVLRGTPAMPRVFFTNSGYEYWGRAASLIHTTIDGKADLEPQPGVRIYSFASTQHFVDAFPPEAQVTRHPPNVADFFWHLRALLVAMNDWVSRDVDPPPSAYPRIAEDTLVDPGGLAFPDIPGVEVPRAPHRAYRVDYGPRFRSQGIVDRQPPEVGKPFPVLVSQVDGDGNEIGGLRLPEIAVPLATYTPWNWRAERIGAPGELADFRGAFLPFARTEAERPAAEDPRPSVEQRYRSREEYIGRYTNASLELVRKRYLLAEDLPAVIGHAGRLWDLVASTDDAN